jgi:hypothetical protein
MKKKNTQIMGEPTKNINAKVKKRVSTLDNLRRQYNKNIDL